MPLGIGPTNETMQQGIINIASIAEYNDLLGVETLHPLVSVINLADARPMRHQRHIFNFYTVFLKEVRCGDIIYGRQTYDYQEGTVVCIAPGQVIGLEDNGEVYQPKGWALCFHPDLIHGTSLGSHINEYSFFSYAVNEALHLSKKEREIFVDCLHKIQLELNHNIDRMTRRLIATNIELLLDYCLRFYERQFITREYVNSDILARFEQLLHDYFARGHQFEDGLPNVAWCASQLCLSPKYLSDLMKKETGHTAIEHIHTKVIAVSKEKLLSPTLTISEIAYQLGFQYPAHFSRMFKKYVGMTPVEYRATLSN